MRPTGPTICTTYDDRTPIAPFTRIPFWCPRIWQGMRVRDWMQLLKEYNFQWDWSRLPLFLLSCSTTGAVGIGRALQRVVWHQEAESTPLVADPIFVIGHWRSGTTLLHELFTLDEQLRAATTYQVFCPYVSIISECWIKPLTWCLIPSKRPMDQMDFSWDSPQEDEFALLSMGLPTTYRRMAFPNEEPRNFDYLNMEGIPEEELNLWKQRFRLYVQYLNLHYNKQLVLKSPPHTGRIKVLLDLFPNAKFVHITRDPQKFIPSTMHLWAALDECNSLQTPKFTNLSEYVFSCYEHIYEGFYRDEHLLHSGNFASVRFNDLVGDPVAEMNRIYHQLQLGPISGMIPRLRERMNRDRDFKQNKHEVPRDLQDEITDRCVVYSERFGYSRESVAA